MDGIEKRPAVKALIEKGKAAGKLTTQEIDTVKKLSLYQHFLRHRKKF